MAKPVNKLTGELRGKENKKELFINPRFDEVFNFLLFSHHGSFGIIKEDCYIGCQTRWFELKDEDDNKYFIRRRTINYEFKRSNLGVHMLKAGRFSINNICFLDGSWYVVPKIREEGPFKMRGHYTADSKHPLFHPSAFWRASWVVDVATNYIQISLGPECIRALTQGIDFKPAACRLPPNLFVSAPQKMDHISHPRLPASIYPVTIKNRGGRMLKWQAVSTASWLRLEPAQGSVNPGQEFYANYMVDAKGLKSGNYSAKLIITCPGAVHAPKKVVVNLEMLKSTDPLPDTKAEIVMMEEK
jgi:hypothetical protein